MQILSDLYNKADTEEAKARKTSSSSNTDLYEPFKEYDPKNVQHEPEYDPIFISQLRYY